MRLFFCAVLAAASVALLVPLAALASPASASGPGRPRAARSATASVTIASRSSSVFYIDSGIVPPLKGMYLAYSVTNTGSPLADVWVTLATGTGNISLAPNEDGRFQLTQPAPGLGTGETKTAFFYVQASGATGTAQSMTVNVYSNAALTSLVGSGTFPITSVEETLQAAANNVNVVVTPSPVVAGSLATITVTGQTGTIGAANVMSFTPAALVDWPADSYEVVSSSIDLSGYAGTPYVNTLLIPPADVAAHLQDTPYTATYTIRVNSIVPGNTVISPVLFASSGNALKHNYAGDFANFIVPTPTPTPTMTPSRTPTPTPTPTMTPSRTPTITPTGTRTNTPTRTPTNTPSVTPTRTPTGPPGAGLFTVSPCRLADTRNADGPSGGPALAANTVRTFPVASLCGIPSSATAVAINLAVVLPSNDGDLRLYPAGGVAPLASSINFRPGIVRANNAVIRLGAGGQISVQCDMPSGGTHFFFDVFGYFQ